MNPTSSSSSGSSPHALTPPRAEPERKGNTPDGPRVLARPLPVGAPVTGTPARALKDKIVRDTKHGSPSLARTPATPRERLQVLQALSSASIRAGSCPRNTK